MVPFLRKKAEEKQNIATIIKSVDGKKKQFFQWSWNYAMPTVWINILKKGFQIRSNEFNWDKSPY